MRRSFHSSVACLLLGAVLAGALASGSFEETVHHSVDELSAPTHGHHAALASDLDASKNEKEESEEAERLVALLVQLTDLSDHGSAPVILVSLTADVRSSINQVAAHGARGPPLA